MGSLLLLHELTRIEAREVARDGIVILPVGATEQHGPHLPTGTDAFAIEKIARLAAEGVDLDVPIVVAPTLPFGSSHHHLPFGGTMSLGTETYYQVITDLVESLIMGGWGQIVIINGHGGNHEIIQVVARDLALKHPASIAAFSYWHPSWRSLTEVGAHDIAPFPGHAGQFETSLMMALRPDLVREPRPHRDGSFAVDAQTYAPLVRVETHGSWQQMDGYTDSPDLGTAENGTTYLEVIVRDVARVLVEFHAATGNRPREHNRD